MPFVLTKNLFINVKVEGLRLYRFFNIKNPEAYGLLLQFSNSPTSVQQPDSRYLFESQETEVDPYPTQNTAMASVAATISYIFHPSITPFTSASTTHCIPFPPISIAPTIQALPSTLNLIRRSHVLLAPIHCCGGDDGGGGNVGGRGGGGGEGDGEDDDEEDEYSSERKKNIGDAAFALAQLGKTVDTIPVDLAAAIEAGRIPVSVLRRFVEMDRSKVLSWLMKFAGFKERILADDLFLAKVAMECGVGMIAKVR